MIEAGLPQTPEKKTFLERDTKIHKIYNDLQNLDSLDSAEQANREILTFFTYLRAMYPDWPKYRVTHLFGGSNLSEKIPADQIIEADFSGDFSIELFMDRLARKYLSGKPTK